MVPQESRLTEAVHRQVPQLCYARGERRGVERRRTKLRNSKQRRFGRTASISARFEQVVGYLERMSRCCINRTARPPRLSQATSTWTILCVLQHTFWASSSSELVAREAPTYRWRSVRWQDSRSRRTRLLEGKLLAAGVGNCVARPGGPQQLLVLQPHAVVQPLRPAPLPAGHKDALAYLSAGPKRRSPGHTCSAGCFVL